MRMGADKCKISIGGKLLIEIVCEKLKSIFDEIILVTDDANKFKDLGYRTVEDIEKDCGPAGGIYTGLKSSSFLYTFMIACDMPFINTDYIRYMIDIVERYEPQCVISKNGEWNEPLYAFYSKDMAEIFESNLKEGKLRVYDIIKKCNVYYVEDKIVRSFSKNLDIFINLNYTKDLKILENFFCEEVRLNGK